MEPFLRKTTLVEDDKKLREFSRIFTLLRAKGTIETTDPRYFKIQHMDEFLLWMKKKNLSLSTQVKYIQVLNRYLTVFGNNAIDKMRSDRTIRLPRESRSKPIKALTQGELQRIFDASNKIQGWRGITIRGFIALAFGTACRPKELTNALESDLNMEKWQFYVRHPKGEGSWSEPEWIGVVRDDMKVKLTEFMAERKEFMERNGLNSKYLFFNQDTLGPYTLNAFHAMKDDISAISGVKFALKDFRSTFTTVTIAGDLSLMKAVSLQLRHQSVITTELYYARIRKSEEVQNAIGNAWKKSEIK